MPTEKIVSACKSNTGKNIYLISQKGTVLCLNNNEIYYANNSYLGYLSEKTRLKNDYFIKIITSNQLLEIETNKNKSSRLNFDKLNFSNNKSIFLRDILKFEKDDFIKSCIRFDNCLD